MKIKKAALGIFIIVSILMITIILFETKRTSFIYSDFGVKIPANYALMGIDVSHHQGDINFNEAAKMTENGDSLEFVYIKATEGTDFYDRNFDKNAEGFAGVKMPYGFYHFFLPRESAEAQAIYFCESVKAYHVKLRPVVDIEVIEQASKAELIDSLTHFLDRVEEILTYRPMIYTYVSFYEDYFIGSELDRELFWLASYSPTNQYMEKENVLIWQFTDHATVNGIGTPVDLNVAKSKFREKVILQ